MAFPEEILADDEELILHLHPHPKVAIGPILLLVLTLGATIVAWVMLPQNKGGLTAFAVVALIMLYYGLRYAVRPLVAWRCTHYVLTDERIVLQDGVIARERREVPLGQVNDYLIRQSLLDRLFGSGTLTVDSIGEEAEVLVAVPRADQVQSALHELIEHYRERHADDEQDEEPEVPEQRRGFFRRRARSRLRRN